MKKKVTAVNAVLSGKVCMYTKHAWSREYELNIMYAQEAGDCFTTQITFKGIVCGVDITESP